MKANDRVYVLYHADCPDGFGAAWAAFNEFESLATYLPIQYGQPLPEIPDGSSVYIVDFSYDRATLTALADRVAKLVVLDHHKTAKAELDGLSFATFDMEKSGAVLTWEHFNPGEPVPALLLYIQDRDLWRWQLPESREVSAALSLEPRDFRHWDRLACDTYNPDEHPALFAKVIEIGRTVLRVQAKHVESLVSKAFTADVGGHAVPAVNSPLFQSELGEELCRRHPDAPFAAVFFVPEPGVEVWSLRSRNGFDVSGVARSLGGGGHAAAAGFKIVKGNQPQ